MAERDGIGETEADTSVPLRLYADNPRPSLTRSNPEAGFLSQVIAERDNLPAQRLRRRAPITTALSAYHQGALRDQRRTPHGYFRSLSV